MADKEERNEKLCYKEYLDEKWRDIENHPNYQISNWGRVIKKNVYNARTLSDYFVIPRNQYVRHKGKLYYYLYVYLDGEKLYVHRLVARHFTKHFKRLFPGKYLVRHKYGTNMNNHIGNLEVVPCK